MTVWWLFRHLLSVFAVIGNVLRVLSRKSLFYRNLDFIHLFLAHLFFMSKFRPKLTGKSKVIWALQIVSTFTTWFGIFSFVQGLLSSIKESLWKNGHYKTSNWFRFTRMRLQLYTNMYGIKLCIGNPRKWQILFIHLFYFLNLHPKLIVVE